MSYGVADVDFQALMIIRDKQDNSTTTTQKVIGKAWAQVAVALIPSLLAAAAGALLGLLFGCSCVVASWIINLLS